MRAEGAVTVDLGTDWEPHVETRPASSVWRQVTAAGAALATVLVSILGGSAAWDPGLIRVASISTGITDTVTLIGDHLFVRGRNATRLDVYALPSGRHLWRLGWPQQVDTLRVDDAAGVLLVETYDVTRPEGTVTAVELDTGRTLWRQAGGLLAAQTQDVDGAALLAPVDISGAGQVRLVDVRTGVVRWSRTAVASTVFAAAGSDRIIQRAPDGDAQVVELSTGRVLVSGVLGGPDPRAAGRAQPDFTTVPNMSTVDGLVLLMYRAEYPTTVVAYDSGTFKERWRAIEDGIVYWVAGCGAVLCADGEQGVTGIDPVTGADRWHATGWSGVYPVGDGSRVAVTASTDGDASALLDTATGAVGPPMRGWAPVNPDARPWLVTSSEVGRLGVWVGLLDAVRAYVSPLAWLPGIANLCEQGGPDPDHTYLACATPTGGTEVWRYRPA